MARYAAAELGGSYVVSLSEAARADVTGQILVTRPSADVGRVEHGSDDDREIARLTRSHVRGAIRAVCDEIFDVYDASLLVLTAQDWHTFWREHRDDLETKIGTLCDLAKLAGLDKKLGRRDEEKCRPIIARFPEAEHEIRFLRGLETTAYKRVRDFHDTPVPEDMAAKDFEYAAFFHHHALNFQVCMGTLDYVAFRDKEIHPDVLAEVFKFARHSALEFTHVSMEAARLRRTPDPLPVPMISIRVSDDDLVDVEKAIRRYERGAKA